MAIYIPEEKNKSGNMEISDKKTSNLLTKDLNFNLGQIEIIKAKPKVKDIALFCRQFSTILEAGISLTRAMDIVISQTSNKVMVKALIEVSQGVKRGKALSEAMKMAGGRFPSFLVNMVAVGETSGNLDSIMKRMADYYEKDARVKRKVKSAMIYPVAILVVTLGVVIFLIKTIVPMFVDMFESSGAELPPPTKLLISLNKLIEQQGLLILLAFIIIIGVLIVWGKSPGGRHILHKLILNIPIIGKLMRKTISSRFARCMAILVNSGVSVVNAIEICQTIVGNLTVEEALEQAKSDIRRGRGFSGPIAEIKYFPKMLSQMISIGEETGSLDAMLSKTADMMDEDVEVAIERTMTLLQPIILVFVAVIVGTIVASIILPVMNMSSAVGDM